MRLSERAGAYLTDYLHGLCSRRELDYVNARTMKLIADAITESCWQCGGFGAEDMREVWERCARIYLEGFSESTEGGI